MRWRGIQLVCCKPHTLLSGARHPWDTPACAEIPDPHLLWAPDGNVQCAHLVRLVIDNRTTFDTRTREVLTRAAAA